MENTKVEISSRQLDKLNHFLAAFESGRVIEAEYYGRFAALAESVDSFISGGMFVEIPDVYKETMRDCIKAAKAQDSSKICEILPAFCDSLQAKLEEGRDQGAEENAFKEYLLELQNALLKKDNAAADKITSKISALKLDAPSRELYFNLYDLLMDDKTEQAIERIKEWLKS